MLRNWPKATEYETGMSINKVHSLCPLPVNYEAKRYGLESIRMVCRQQNMEEDRKERCRMKESGRLLRGIHARKKQRGPRQEILQTLTLLEQPIDRKAESCLLKGKTE